MTTAEAALNGLTRSLQFSQEQLNSDSSFYSSGINQLLQIRELASQVMMAANSALAKVDLDNPKYIVKVGETSLDVGDIAAKVASEVTSTILTQLNLVNQQNIYVDQMVQCNQPINQSQVKASDEVINVEIEETKEFSQSATNSNYVPEFKSVLNSVSSLSDDQFGDEHVKTCAELCSNYFNVRFNKKFDPQGIHKFKKSEFSNYLYSIVLAYSESIALKKENQFKSQFYSWIEAVQKGHIPYTLPKSVAEKYFSYFNSKTRENLEIFSDIFHIFSDIWTKLWDLGYWKFKFLKNDQIFPKKDVFNDFQCIDSKISSDLADSEHYLNSCSEITLQTKSFNESFDNSYSIFQDETGIMLPEAQKAKIKDLVEVWVECESSRQYEFSISEAIISKSLLSSIEFYDFTKIPEGTLFKSLMFYVTKVPESSLDEVEDKMRATQDIDEFEFNSSIFNEIISIFVKEYEGSIRE